MTIQELDQKAKCLAQTYRKAETELLSVIIKLDKLKGFYQLGYNSLFSYATGALQLSPAIAYGLINVARKSHEVPALKKQVESGRLSISKAQKMTSILTKENHRSWFKAAKTKTHRELEREVALVSPRQAVQEKVKYIAPGTDNGEKITIKRNAPRIALQIGLSEKIMLKLRRAQDLESQRKRENLNLEETLENILDLYLDKRDPLKKAQRQQARGKLLEHKQKLYISDINEERTPKQKLEIDEPKEIDTSNSRFRPTLKSTSSNPSNLNQVSTVDGVNEASPRGSQIYGHRQEQLQEEPPSFTDLVTPAKNRIAVSPSQRTKRHRTRQCRQKQFPEELPNLTDRPKSVENAIVISSGQRVKKERHKLSASNSNSNKDHNHLPIGSLQARRKPIPARIVHQVQLRDQGQCTYIDNLGKRCSSRRYLEIHHRKPVARGGENTLNNLTLLCTGHHKSLHSKTER